jgi:4-hydroxy-4-methyl-2-oxoglutarate aldolase
LNAEQLAQARQLGTATLHEAAGRIGALPSVIKPAASSFAFAGPAFTVHCPPNDNLWIHRALSVATAGEILVVYTSGFYDAGYWGEIMSAAAASARLGGLVIDACVRDARALEMCGFPVFARGFCIRGTGKDFGATGWLGRPIILGEIVINPGDLVVGDLDGVVCIPRGRVVEVLTRSQKREAEEKVILDRLRSGESTLEIYGLDR